MSPCELGQVTRSRPSTSGEGSILPRTEKFPVAKDITTARRSRAFGIQRSRPMSCFGSHHTNPMCPLKILVQRGHLIIAMFERSTIQATGNQLCRSSVCPKGFPSSKMLVKVANLPPSGTPLAGQYSPSSVYF